MRSVLSTLAIGLLAFALPTIAFAQDYPKKPVTIVVPAAAGGNIDRVARIIAPKLAEIWGQPVVIDNQPGAANALGTRNVIQSAPDGYHLLMGSLGPNVLTPLAMAHVGKNVGYDPQKDLTPIVNLTTQAFVLLVRSDSPYKTLNHLMDAMRVKNNTINYATSGYGTVSHFGTEVFKKAVGGDMTMIPYASDAPAQVALLGGEADVYLTVTSSAAGLLEAGTVRPLLVTSPERSPRAPGALSLTDAGLSGPDLQIWIGLFGPAGVPDSIVEKINTDTRAALEDSKVRKALETGQEILTGDVQWYRDFIQQQLSLFAKDIKAINFNPVE